MIYKYCLQKLTTIFLFAFTVLTGILSIASLLDKSSLVIPLQQLPLFIAASMPILAVYTVPLCLSIAIFFLFSRLHSSGEFDIICQFSAATRSIRLVVLAAAGALAIGYGFLVMQWAPQSYELSKRLILSLARYKLTTLEPGVIHQPFPGISLSCAQLHHVGNNGIAFKEIMLLSADKKNNVRLFRARAAQFDGDMFRFSDGNLTLGSPTMWQKVLFKNLWLRASTLIGESIGNAKSQVKRLPVGVLLVQATADSLFEFYKRCSLILWMLIIALMSLLIASWWRAAISIPLNFTLSGCLFFALYTSHVVAAAIRLRCLPVAYFLLFVLPCILLVCSYSFLRIKKGF